LSRLTKNILLCFDSDEAGINATLRAIEIAANTDVKLDVINLGGAKDPDELLKKDPKLWEDSLKSSKYAPDFLIDFAKNKFGISTAPGKKNFTEFILPLLRSLKNEIEIQHYTKKIAQLLDVSEDSIKKLTKDSSRGLQINKDAPTEETIEGPAQRKLTRQENLEKELLELIFAFPELNSLLDDLSLDRTSELHRPLFEFLKSNHKFKFDDALKALPNQAEYVKILSLRGEQEFADATAHDKRLEAFTQIARIEDINKQIAKRQVAKQLSVAEAEGDSKKIKNLLRQYQALLNEE
jgi:DNA primase